MSIPAQRPPEPERPHFDMVLRGYDRIEVDAYIDQLLGENSALRRQLESATAPRAPEPVVEAPAPREAPAAAPPTGYYDVDTPAEDSFGFRAEKLLRLAERESAEMRTRATRDAETVEATARRRAEEHVRAAERDADQIRAEATQEAGRVTKQATQEAARVGYLHRSTKDELRRLASLLNAELERPDPEVPAADADEAPVAEHESAGTAASNR